MQIGCDDLTNELNSGNEIELSIIVPMYKVEQYIANCLDSLLDQMIDSFEIICIDDGSPDESGEIAEEYSLRDDRIRVIHQDNSGLGPARNTGIQYARGKYIGFVDSDDWVSKDFYKVLCKTAEDTEADIVSAGYCEVKDGRVGTVHGHPLAGKTYSSKEEIIKLRAELYGHSQGDKTVQSFPMNVWSCIYRASMIRDHYLRFNNVISEDTLFNLDAYAVSRRIAYVRCNGYMYRKDGQASITQSFNQKLLSEYSIFLSHLKKSAKESDCSEDLIARVERTAVDLTRTYIRILASSSLGYWEKRQHLLSYFDSDVFRKYAKNYPLRYLPFQQMVFQKLLILHCFFFVLLLAKSKGRA